MAQRPEIDATILLLSSEPVIRLVLTELLEGAGYIVLAAPDLGVAVDRLGECSVDLLVTHPYVNGISGHDAAKYLRQKNPHMAILLVAGFIDDERLRYREALESFDIFPQPFSGAELLKKVAEVLKKFREREARNAPEAGRPPETR